MLFLLAKFVTQVYVICPKDSNVLISAGKYVKNKSLCILNSHVTLDQTLSKDVIEKTKTFSLKHFTFF